jgi:hypothetical protein
MGAVVKVDNAQIEAIQTAAVDGLESKSFLIFLV